MRVLLPWKKTGFDLQQLLEIAAAGESLDQHETESDSDDDSDNEDDHEVDSEDGHDDSDSHNSSTTSSSHPPEATETPDIPPPAQGASASSYSSSSSATSTAAASSEPEEPSETGGSTFSVHGPATTVGEHTTTATKPIRSRDRCVNRNNNSENYSRSISRSPPSSVIAANPLLTRVSVVGTSEVPRESSSPSSSLPEQEENEEVSVEVVATDSNNSIFAPTTIATKTVAEPATAVHQAATEKTTPPQVSSSSHSTTTTTTSPSSFSRKKRQRPPPSSNFSSSAFVEREETEAAGPASALLLVAPEAAAQAPALRPWESPGSPTSFSPSSPPPPSIKKAKVLAQQPPLSSSRGLPAIPERPRNIPTTTGTTTTAVDGIAPNCLNIDPVSAALAYSGGSCESSNNSSSSVSNSSLTQNTAAAGAAVRNHSPIIRITQDIAVYNDFASETAPVTVSTPIRAAEELPSVCSNSSSSASLPTRPINSSASIDPKQVTTAAANTITSSADTILTSSTKKEEKDTVRLSTMTAGADYDDDNSDECIDDIHDCRSRAHSERRSLRLKVVTTSPSLPNQASSGSSSSSLSAQPEEDEDEPSLETVKHLQSKNMFDPSQEHPSPREEVNPGKATEVIEKIEKARIDVGAEEHDAKGEEVQEDPAKCNSSCASYSPEASPSDPITSPHRFDSSFVKMDLNDKSHEYDESTAIIHPPRSTSRDEKPASASTLLSLSAPRGLGVDATANPMGRLKEDVQDRTERSLSPTIRVPSQQQRNRYHSKNFYPQHSNIELAFAESLRKRGLELVEQEGDGNCLFRAIALQVYGDASAHSEVRRLVCQYMSRDPEHFGSFVENEKFVDYVARKSQDGVHGNNPELQACCELFNRPIEVYTPDCGVDHPMNLFHGEYKTRDTPIRLAYHDGNHYNAIVNPLEPTAGLGLGLPGLQLGLADKLQVGQAKIASDALHDEEVYQRTLRESSQAYELAADDALQRAIKESAFSVDHCEKDQAMMLSDLDATNFELEQTVLQDSLLAFAAEQGRKQRARNMRPAESSPTIAVAASVTPARVDIPVTAASSAFAVAATNSASASASGHNSTSSTSFFAAPTTSALSATLEAIPSRAATAVAYAQSLSSSHASSTTSSSSVACSSLSSLSPTAAATSLDSSAATVEYPECVQELVVNGFPLEKVVRAYELVGDSFDDLLNFLMSCQSSESS